LKLELNGHTCVARTAAGEILTSDEHGILPPLRWLREDPALLRGADVADRVIGKAAALLFAHGGVHSLWAARMSEAARDFLRTAGIDFAYEKLVPAILNRDGTGLCPMEQRALGMEEPGEAFRVFDGVIAK
jgi:iron complex outermembrane receptor protein/vitamin B12 transporter